MWFCYVSMTIDGADEIIQVSIPRDDRDSLIQMARGEVETPVPPVYALMRAGVKWIDIETEEEPDPVNPDTVRITIR
jgi:hypothetical protein